MTKEFLARYGHKGEMKKKAIHSCCSSHARSAAVGGTINELLRLGQATSKTPTHNQAQGEHRRIALHPLEDRQAKEASSRAKNRCAVRPHHESREYARKILCEVKA